MRLLGGGLGGGRGGGEEGGGGFVVLGLGMVVMGYEIRGVDVRIP